MRSAHAGRTYVVTGSASGIGRATKERLEREGHTVIGVDFVGGETVQADLSTSDGRRQMIDDVTAAAQGSVHGVIAVAGTGGSSIESIIGVNYFGAVAALDGLRELLAGADRPRAAVVSSVRLLDTTDDDAAVQACLSGDPRAAIEACGSAFAAYAASKRAIALWVREHAVSAAWAGSGIALNAVAPGVINTPLISGWLADFAAHDTPAAWAQPYGGLGSAESVASLLIWLTSAENDLVSGQVLYCDGGYEAQMMHGALPTLPRSPLFRSIFQAVESLAPDDPLATFMRGAAPQLFAGTFPSESDMRELERLDDRSVNALVAALRRIYSQGSSII